MDTWEFSVPPGSYLGFICVKSNQKPHKSGRSKEFASANWREWFPITGHIFNTVKASECPVQGNMQYWQIYVLMCNQAKSEQYKYYTIDKSQCVRSNQCLPVTTQSLRDNTNQSGEERMPWAPHARGEWCQNRKQSFGLRDTQPWWQVCNESTARQEPVHNWSATSL